MLMTGAIVAALEGDVDAGRQMRVMATMRLERER